MFVSALSRRSHGQEVVAGLGTPGCYRLGLYVFKTCCIEAPLKEHPVIPKIIWIIVRNIVLNLGELFANCLKYLPKCWQLFCNSLKYLPKY